MLFQACKITETFINKEIFLYLIRNMNFEYMMNI